MKVVTHKNCFCRQLVPKNVANSYLLMRERPDNLALFLLYLCCPKALLTHLTVNYCAIYTIKCICHIKLSHKNCSHSRSFKCQLFSKYICHIQIGQIYSSTQGNKNCHKINCHIKIACDGDLVSFAAIY